MGVAVGGPRAVTMSVVGGRASKEPGGSNRMADEMRGLLDVDRGDEVEEEESEMPARRARRLTVMTQPFDLRQFDQPGSTAASKVQLTTPGRPRDSATTQAHLRGTSRTLRHRQRWLSLVPSVPPRRGWTLRILFGYTQRTERLQVRA